MADPDQILRLLRDPNVESQEIANLTGAPREEAGRAARIVAAITKTKPEEALSLPPQLALAVARAALEVGRAELLVAFTSHPSRDVCKEAKRGLHILKTRGVAVPDLPRAAPPQAPATPEPAFDCFASAIDGRGERAVWVTRSVPGKGVEIGQVILSDTLGLLELQVGLLGRKEFRTFSRELVERGRSMGVGLIDRELAKSLAAAARALNDQSGSIVPRGADPWLAKLGPARPLEDPAAQFPPLPDEEERAALESSASLHDLPLLAPWVAEDEPLQTLERKLAEISVSPLYIDEGQRKEQSLRVVADAVENYLDEPRRRRLASRLFQIARHFVEAGDAPNSQRAAAAARAAASGTPGSRIPFVRLLIEKAVAAASGSEGGENQPEPSAPESSLLIHP